MHLRATSRSATDASWRALADDALARPEGHLDRLYDLAARDQWTVAGLDWSSIDLLAIPEPIRQTAADLFAQLHFGELTAMSSAARLMAHLDDPSARLVCATQINDEARHARFFESLIARLGCEGRVRPSTEAMMREILECDTPEGTMLGMQLLIEGAAHSLFLEGARAMSALELGGELPPSLRAAKTIVCEWLPVLLGRDESRHIAFGLAYLRARVPALDLARRDALEESIARWGEMLLGSAREPDLIDGVGLDGLRISARCVEDLNLRLAQIGLSTRIDSVASS